MMFTGLVEEVGRVVSLTRRSTGALLVVRTGLGPLEPGESVAVNGVCQTVSRFEGGNFTCDVLPETLRVTNLGDLRPGSNVNLERALKASGRLGGHIVNGHVDGCGTIFSVKRNPPSLGISVDPAIGLYLVAKGSVAVDGISLTVGPDPSADRFTVFVIPHTMENTNLRDAAPGRKVNIEADILAKYVHKFSRL